MSIRSSIKPMAYAVALIASGGLLSACGGSSSDGPIIEVSDANAYLLTSQNRIVGVDLDDQEYARSSIGILRNASEDTDADEYSFSALDKSETILDIDYRNSEGLLYALTRDVTEGRIIIINQSNGTIIRMGTLSAADGDVYEKLGETASYTIDFNPGNDTLRVIGSDGSNLSVAITSYADAIEGAQEDPVIEPTALVTTHANIGCSPAECTAPTLTGAGYTDPDSSQLFGVDKDKIYELNNAEGSVDSHVTASRALGITDASEITGYDINQTNNQGVALVHIGDTQKVYTIDSSATATGNAATLLTTLPPLTDDSYTRLSIVAAAPEVVAD